MVAINSAESNRAVVRAIPEVTWATTPTSGKTDELRITSSSLTVTKDTAVSDEIRADRMISSIIEVAASSGGDINYEFSAGSQDSFFQAFLLGAWTKTMDFFKAKGSHVSVTANNTFTITGGTLTNYFGTTANDWFKAEGFINPENNGHFKVTAVTATTLVIAGTARIVEAGTANTKVMDAGDVITSANDITFGQTVSGKSIEDGAGTGIADAITAGQLLVGQYVFVDGYGYYTQTVTFSAAVPTAGDLVTISDGTDTIVFEVGTASSVTAGNIPFAPGANVTDAATNFAAAVMGQLADGSLRCSADSALGVATVVNFRDNAGSLTETGANIAVGGATFAGLAANHGVFRIETLGTASFNVVGTLANSANGSTIIVTIKGSHLRNPGTLAAITKQSFTMETGFTDINKYFVQRGQRVGSFSMSVASGEIVTGSFSFMGQGSVVGNTSTLGNTGSYTVLPTTATEVFNATANVGSINKDGVTLTTALQSIEINGDANLREQRAVSEKFPAGIGYGRFNLTGTITAYFDTLDFYNDFLNHTTRSIGWDFEDVDHNKYYFTIPAIKLIADPIAPGGIDEDIMEELEWNAQRDQNLNTMFMIDRMSSVIPVTSR